MRVDSAWLEPDKSAAGSEVGESPDSAVTRDESRLEGDCCSVPASASDTLVWTESCLSKLMSWAETCPSNSMRCLLGRDPQRDPWS